MFPLLLLFVATLIATSQAQGDHVHLLLPQSGDRKYDIPSLSCLSWHLAVETNNVRLDKVPKQSEDYVKNYTLGDQYKKDSALIIDEAFLYARNLALGDDGKDIWVFDIDETTLSNLPYYAKHGFGTEPRNTTSMKEWFEESDAPALPASLYLYNNLLSLRIKVVFLTGRSESLRNATAINLQKEGYTTWEKLILKGSDYPSKLSNEKFKSHERRKLEEIDGYRIIGNIGDQWSDITGINTGQRTFKLPNPMYYIP